MSWSRAPSVCVCVCILECPLNLFLSAACEHTLFAQLQKKILALLRLWWNSWHNCGNLSCASLELYVISYSKTPQPLLSTMGHTIRAFLLSFVNLFSLFFSPTGTPWDSPVSRPGCESWCQLWCHLKNSDRKCLAGGPSEQPGLSSPQIDLHVLIKSCDENGFWKIYEIWIFNGGLDWDSVHEKYTHACCATAVLLKDTAWYCAALLNPPLLFAHSR